MKLHRSHGMKRARTFGNSFNCLALCFTIFQPSIVAASGTWTALERYCLDVNSSIRPLGHW